MAETLPQASLDQAIETYEKISPLINEWTGLMSAVGIIDRYYLLTRILRRVDFLSHGQKGNEWLYARVREVEAEPDEFLDLWAREHGKSSTVSFAGTIEDVLVDPETTIGIFSHTRGIAKSFLRQIMRELEGNELLKSLYPDVFWGDPKEESPKWSEDDGLVVRRKTNPKEATVEAWGLTDSQPIGRHFRIRVYDDVVTDKSVTTTEQIRKTTEMFELSDNLGTVDGTFRMVGTRYHFADTYGVLEQRGSVKTRIYPATHDGTKGGRPVFWSDEVWEKKKRAQPTTLPAQLLLNPAAGEEALFRLEWQKTFEVRPHTLNIYILVDPSLGRTRESDNTAMAVIGVDAQSNKYLIDGYRHRMNLRQRWLALKALYKKWSEARGVVMAKVCYERYGLQSDVEHFQEKMRIENYSFPIEEVNWVREGPQSKEDRIARLVPDVQEGKLFIPAIVHHETRGGPARFDANGSALAVAGPALWKADGQAIQYFPLEGPTRLQTEIERAGQIERVQRALLRRDFGEPPQLYDLTRAYLEEMQFFPFGAKRDLLDACSRVYDAEVVPPMIMPAGGLEPAVYIDT